MNIGSLYQCFPNRDALVAAVMAQMMDGMKRMLLQVLDDASALPLGEATRRIIGAHIEVHRKDPALHRVLIEQRGRLKPDAPLRALRTEVRERLRDWLASRKEVKVRDLELAVFFVAQLVEDLTIAIVVQKPADLGSAEVVDEMAELVVGYLTGHDGLRRRTSTSRNRAAEVPARAQSPDVSIFRDCTSPSDSGTNRPEVPRDARRASSSRRRSRSRRH